MRRIASELQLERTNTNLETERGNEKESLKEKAIKYDHSNTEAPDKKWKRLYERKSEPRNESVQVNLLTK